MGIWIETDKLDRVRLDTEQKLHVYNGLDCMLTLEVYEEIKPELKPETTAITYEFSKGMHGPAFTMMRRGFRVSEERIQKALHGDPDIKRPKYRMDFTKEGMKNWQNNLGLKGRIRFLSGIDKVNKGKRVEKWVNEVVEDTAYLQRLSRAASGKSLNYRSGAQVQALLYDTLGIPKQYHPKRGTVTVDNEALSKIATNYPRGAAIARCILRLRELDKLVSVLETERDDDGRIRCSYNVVGTETGRWSSSSTPFNTGTNLQNITHELRGTFEPDPGYKLIYADLKSAESFAVGHLAGDENYIAACNSSDLHTMVASMVFGIPGEREEADKIYFQHFSYRDMAKRAGHGTNYMLTPHSLARQHKITVATALQFSMLYLGGEITEARAKKAGLLDFPHEKEGKLLFFPGKFPRIRAWHAEIAEAIQTGATIVTPFGRERHFWGNPNDNKTLREAVAYGPQSTVGDLLNIALYRAWKYLEGSSFQLLGQVHDAIVAQVRTEEVDEVIPELKRLMMVETPVNGRIMRIPADVEIGDNWHDLEKWQPTT